MKKATGAKKCRPDAAWKLPNTSSDWYLRLRCLDSIESTMSYVKLQFITAPIPSIAWSENSQAHNSSLLTVPRIAVAVPSEIALYHRLCTWVGITCAKYAASVSCQFITLGKSVQASRSTGDSLPANGDQISHVFLDHLLWLVFH